MGGEQFIFRRKNIFKGCGLKYIITPSLKDKEKILLFFTIVLNCPLASEATTLITQSPPIVEYSFI
jgi:hypothetical protein